MVKSKAWMWNWDDAATPQWVEPAGEIYPLLSRWKKADFKKLLDLGCGIGRHALLFAENGFETEAFDLSEEGINKLDELTKKKKLVIKSTVGDMLSLPYADDSFDCLVSYHTIYHSDDQGITKAIGEIGRVLRNGGEAYLTFNSQSSDDYKNPENKHLTPNTIIKSKGYEIGIPHYYATKSDVQKLLENFNILQFSYKEEYYPNYTGAHYYVLVANKKHE